MHVFFVEVLSGQDDVVFLGADDSRHCIKVLRLRVGDAVRLLDGKGQACVGLIEQANYRRCGIRVRDCHYFSKPAENVHIALAPTKNAARLGWFVEKAVELGAGEISFFCGQYSERRVLKIERLRRLAVSALKQSVQYYLPKINPLCSFEAFLERVGAESALFIAHTEACGASHLFKFVASGRENCVLIGPEGGFSEAELGRAVAQGAKPVSLGGVRLRTETAALAALHTLKLACLLRAD